LQHRVEAMLVDAERTQVERAKLSPRAAEPGNGS
jgi:hypothetical protein